MVIKRPPETRSLSGQLRHYTIWLALLLGNSCSQINLGDLGCCVLGQGRPWFFHCLSASIQGHVTLLLAYTPGSTHLPGGGRALWHPLVIQNSAEENKRLWALGAGSPGQTAKYRGHKDGGTKKKKLPSFTNCSSRLEANVYALTSLHLRFHYRSGDHLHQLPAVKVAPRGLRGIKWHHRKDKGVRSSSTSLWVLGILCIVHFFPFLIFPSYQILKQLVKLSHFFPPGYFTYCYEHY